MLRQGRLRELGTMDIVVADGAWSGWFTGIEDPIGQTDSEDGDGGDLASLLLGDEG